MAASSIASSAAASVRPAIAANSRVHLLVVCHGLWGTRSHVGYICQSALTHATASAATPSRARETSPTRGAAEDEIKLVVLPASLNENTFTYDGIDVCGERVVEEIDEEIARLEENGSKVERFSIVGYSLGGLIARYTLGLLHSRTPSFFDQVRPVNFATFASPAIGIPTYKTFWSKFIRYLGARFLSRSGSQLYENDRFLPSSIAEGNNQKCAKPIAKKLFGRKEKASPLLSVMADPRYSFYKALLLFERVEVYANAVKDRTVPYPTGAIEAHDPFALAMAKATKLAAARGEDTRTFSSHPIDIREGGLEVTSQKGVHLVESYKAIALPPAALDQTATKQKRPFQLPTLLRPSSYPFSRPVSVAVIVFLPIALPLLFTFLVGRFALEGNGSRRRIKGFRAKTGDGREGMLARVGVKLQETVGVISENAGPNSPETAIGAGLDGQFDEESGSLTPSGPAEQEPLKTHPAFAALASYGGTDTPPMSRGGEPDENVELTATLENGEPLPTDPILSPAQVEMIKNLNAIPQLRKHLAFLPMVRNSHASIVARDLNQYAEHRNGKAIVDHWAKEFRL